MINQIQEDTGADITIEDDGTIYIGAADGASARRRVRRSTRSPTRHARGRRALPGHRREDHHLRRVRLADARKDGLLHVSQLRKIAGGKRVENVEDVVKVGDKLQVEIAEIDQRGKLSLIPVVAEAESQDAARPTPPPRRTDPVPRRAPT